MNNTIDDLNRQIAALKDRIQVLLQENAAQKAKIEEQENTIAEQKATIEDQARQITAYIATNDVLRKRIEECEAKMDEDDKTIKNLTERNTNLVDTLQKERFEARDRVKQMNEDFEKEKLSIFNDHAAKIEEMKRRGIKFVIKKIIYFF